MSQHWPNSDDTVRLEIVFDKGINDAKGGGGGGGSNAIEDDDYDDDDNNEINK